MTAVKSKIWVLYIATFISVFGALAYVLLGLPVEASQGFAQKIFFFHVPSAFAMYACLIIGASTSALFLYDRKLIYDQCARACLYVATIYSIVVITSGPLWAKPIWGVYWTWDPRLTTSFIVFILLVAYCFVRKIFDESENQSDRGAIVGAILALIAALDIPLIHYSVKIWRGIHPSVLANKEGLPPEYRQGLEVMLLGMFLFSALLISIAFRLIKLKARQRENL
jgi:heme exporter protein C